MGPFFSVVMPAYNAESCLEKTLESIAKQTFKDFEVVIVDNGSRDKTYDIAKSFLEKNKIMHNVVKLKDNVGIGPGRNVGIKAAKGKYVAFMDSDDIWYPKKLEKIHEVLSKDPEIGVLCNDEYLIVNGKKLGSMVYGPYKENMYESLLFEVNCLSSASVADRKKLLEVGGFSNDLNFHGVEDYDLWLKMAKICKFYFLHEFLGEYVITGSNTSGNVERQVQNELKVINQHFASLSPEKQDKNRLKKRYARVYFGAGWGLHRQGKFSESRKWYIKAIKEYPLLYKPYVTIPLSFLSIRW